MSEGGCSQAIVLSIFQCWGVLLIWLITGQGLFVLVVGAAGRGLDILL